MMSLQESFYLLPMLLLHQHAHEVFLPVYAPVMALSALFSLVCIVETFAILLVVALLTPVDRTSK